jgi:hypothetical protein
LREKLSNGHPDRGADTKHILSLWDEDSPMAAIVRMLTERSSSTESHSMSDLDLPPEIEQLSPREWSDWELYRLRVDLSFLQFDFNCWPIVPEEFANDPLPPQP